MQIMMKSILVSIVLICFFCMVYCCFANVFSDDIKFSGGHKIVKQVRKKHGLISNALYLPFIRKIRKVHYVFFVANIITFVLLLLAVNISIWTNDDSPNTFTRLSAIAFLITSLGAILPRRNFYWSNLVKRRKR